MYFKTTQDLGSIDAVFECLNSKFGDKYKISINRATQGVLKIFTEQQDDMISIKKNAYHGVNIMVSGKIEGADYQTINVSEYTPNPIVHRYIGRTGILDIFISRLIWGKGDEFYDEINNFFKTEYAATEVNNSFWNNAKQMFKGKTVFDEPEEK